MNSRHSRISGSFILDFGWTIRTTASTLCNICGTDNSAITCWSLSLSKEFRSSYSLGFLVRANSIIRIFCLNNISVFGYNSFRFGFTIGSTCGGFSYSLTVYNWGSIGNLSSVLREFGGGDLVRYSVTIHRESFKMGGIGCLVETVSGF